MTALDLFWIVLSLANIVTWSWVGYLCGLEKGRAEWREVKRPDGWVLYTRVFLRAVKVGTPLGSLGDTGEVRK